MPSPDIDIEAFKKRFETFQRTESDHLTYNSLLYDFPELYHHYLPHEDRCPFINEMIRRHCPSLPSGVLDLGCGTGKILHGVSAADGQPIRKVGVETHGAMIAFGKERFRDAIEYVACDMKDYQGEQQFSLVLCIGTVLQYAHSNSDLRTALAVIERNLAPGGLAILDVKNSATYLQGIGGLQKFVEECTLDSGFFRGTKRSRVDFDLRKQLVNLRVDWEIEVPAKREFHDFCQYRLLFPQELTFMTEGIGLKVHGIWDRFAMEPTADFSGDRLIVVATKHLK